MTNILIIDDEESIRFSLKNFLQNIGYEVRTATDIMKAKTLLSSIKFDVAIIDRILNGGQNGLDLVKHIKETQPFCETILITAYPDFTSASEILKYDSFAYLTKPIKKKEFCKIVKDAVKRNLIKKRLKGKEILFHSLFQSSPNAIVITDIFNRTRFVNPSFITMFGYSREELLGKTIPYVPLWDQKKTKTEINDLLKAKNIPERETERLTKKGQSIKVRIIQSICNDHDGKPANIVTIIRDRAQLKINW
ncbi:MAG: response regulator [bacterium]